MQYCRYTPSQADPSVIPKARPDYGAIRRASNLNLNNVTQGGPNEKE